MPEFVPGAALFIVQHPGTGPMKLALETNSILRLYGQGRRVRHQTNTEKGASGAPCFDANWNLTAVHHSGDPRLTPTWNEAVPIHLIREHLAAQGFAFPAA
jgi:hypothetical protein